MAKNQHVLLQNGKWAVKTEGSTLPTAVYNSKQEAIDAARKMASANGRNLLVHGRSGQILRGSVAPTTLNEDKLRAAIRLLGQTSATKTLTRKKSGAVKSMSNVKRTKKAR